MKLTALLLSPIFLAASTLSIEQAKEDLTSLDPIDTNSNHGPFGSTNKLEKRDCAPCANKCRAMYKVGSNELC